MKNEIKALAGETAAVVDLEFLVKLFQDHDHLFAKCANIARVWLELFHEIVIVSDHEIEVFLVGGIYFIYNEDHRQL